MKITMIYITSYQNYILLFVQLITSEPNGIFLLSLGLFLCHIVTISYCIILHNCANFVKAVVQFMNIWVLRGVKPVISLQSLCFSPSSPCVCRNYLQSHPRCQLVSLDEWQKRNHLSYRRFAKVPDIFHGSPVLWFIYYFTFIVLYICCRFVPFLCHRYKGEDHWFVLLVSCSLRSPIWFVF